MRGLLWLLALFAAAVGISLAARFNDGYLLLVYPPYRAEISLNLAIALLIGGFAALYAVLRTVALTLALPARVRAFRAERRRNKAAATLQDATRLLFEGRYGQALKKAGEAHQAGQSPGVAALVAARAAQRLRESDKQQHWVERARQADPQMEAASLMLAAEMHLDMRRFEAAAQSLQRLQALSGRHIAALRLELRAQQGCADWVAVLRIARLLEKRNGLQPEAVAEIKLKAHQETIAGCQGDLAQLQACLRQIPSREFTPRLARVAAEALLALEAPEAHDEALRLIETQLDKGWDSELIALYGRHGGKDVTARIARADQWLLQHPDDPQLLLALGRLCLAQRLWGKAQSYLEAALSLADRRAIRLELASLLEQTGRTEAAMQHYRAAAGLPT